MSRLTRDEFAEMLRCKERAPVLPVGKRREAKQMSDEVARFLARGGHINVIPIGVSGDRTEIKRKSDAAKGGKATARSSRG